MPDGTVLIVGSQCELHPDGPDQNAVVLEANGAVLRRATLGHGVDHLQTTASGEVWAGYADEGIYGNWGWGDPDLLGPDGQPVLPIGWSGLVRFGRSLSAEWEFDARGAAGREALGDERPFIDGVLALNVIRETAWIYYFSAHAVARVEDDGTRLWATGREGGGLLLVAGDRVAFVGGYPPEHDQITIGRLGEHRFEPSSAARLVLPDGSPLPPAARLVGRGSTLHVINDRTRLRLDLESVV